MTSKKVTSEHHGSAENRFRHRLTLNPKGANHDVALIKSRIEALKSKIISGAPTQSGTDIAISPVEIAEAIPETMAPVQPHNMHHEDHHALAPIPDPNANFDLHDHQHNSESQNTPIMDEAERTETEDGFQIFKARSMPKKSDPIPAPQAMEESKKSVDPVPMEQDAIEEALKLIQDEDSEDMIADAPSHAIGFTPSGLSPDDFNPGSFGGHGAPSNDVVSSLDIPQAEMPQISGDDDITKAQRDEMDIAAALSEEFGVSQDLTTASADAEMDIVEPTVLNEQQRQNMEIGQSMAKSIKSIISDEVDQTLDRIARQAVRDALKAHRAP